MKKLLSILILLFITTNMSAAPVTSSKEAAFTTYKPSYLIINQNDIKGQVSINYNLLYPFKTGLHFAYTELFIWRIWDDSSPFYDYNHQPELFVKLNSNDNVFDDFDLPYLDYIQLGVKHNSNGRDEVSNRSMNYTYAEFQSSTGTYYNYGFNMRVFKLFGVAEDNKDIDRYIGYYEGELFLQVRGQSSFIDKERIYLKWGSGSGLNGFDFKHGWQEIGVKVRLLTSKIQPYFFLQVWNGYGECLLDYDKRSTSIRIGLILE